jgi:uncharacterized protein YqeY
MKKEINNFIKDAMLSGNKIELSVFRFIKTEFTKFETSENAAELTIEEEIKILNKMVKQRVESVEQYILAKRKDLADKEQEEIEIIKKFLPKEATEDEIKSYLDSIFEKEDKNMGNYIKKIKQKFAIVNGKLVADIVKAKLFI